MDYPQVVEWLFSQLANYHKQGSSAYKPGLENIIILLNKLGNPHIPFNTNKGFKSIHIAGTNGKGSTANIIAAMAIENGYRVGLFTSPHIKDFRERIRINGQKIEESFVVDFVMKHKATFEKLNPSFFEITTAMAFAAFSEKNCDYAIVETGLGGRLDSTNVLDPEISVITNIGLDHTEILGETLEAIANEKAGIIKRNKPVIIGEILPKTKVVFEERVKKMNTKIYRPTKHQFKLDLLGVYQQNNANLAWKTLQVLKQKGHYFDDKKSELALQRICQLTGFSGRLTQIDKNPTIIIDASHNPAGISTLLCEIESIPHNELHCVFGSGNDKDYTKSMFLLPKEAKYYLTNFNSVRAVDSQILGQLATTLQLQYLLFESPVKALQAAKSNAKIDDLILVFGSFYLLENIN